jgi:FkbM family methyltransferase
MSILNILIKIAGRRSVQNILAKNVYFSQYLMGIGSGDSVLSSGESTIFSLLKQRTKPPYCIFDIGSNKGQFLQLALDRVSGTELSIHCFEPGNETFKVLTEKYNQDKRIKLNNIGIGKEKGEAVLHYDEAGSGMASLTKRKLDHFGISFSESEKVEITTVDNYCLEKKIDHIHLLKLDIEGHELDALEGARRLFETKAIDMVTFEFGGCNIDSRTFFQDFWYFFKKHNMRILRITPSGYLHPIWSYQEVHEQFRTTNYVAILKAGKT